MATGLAKFFNIEKDEQIIVTILLLQSVFLGIFVGAFDVGAHSLFLKYYDASMIPGAFVLSGLAGIFITSVYTRLQRRMKYSSFMMTNLAFVALTSLLLRVGFEFTRSHWLVYLVFVLMGPLTIISLLGFWGNVSRIFTLRQGKRLFGIIDTGQIIGIIISSYAIPVLMSLQFAILDTLIISSASIFIALVIQFYISRKAHFTNAGITNVRRDKKESGFFSLFKSNYTVLITLFVGFSVVTAFFVHYSFISVTQINYPDPENLASFLGAFMGTLMVFTVFVKAFLYGRLVRMYGLRFALLVTPVLLGLFTILALLSGSYYGLGKETAGFTIFFLLLALSKLFVKSLKDSIEVPSSKILYQSLEPEIRYDVQARIDGTVNEISAFFSGILLAGLGLLATINLIHYSAVLMVVIILWLFVGIFLYRAYRDSLFSALKRFRNTITPFEETQNELDESEGVRLFYSLRLLPQLWNGYFSGKLKDLISGTDIRLADEASSLIKRLGISDEELLSLQAGHSADSDNNKIIKSGLLKATSSSEIRNLINSRDVASIKRAVHLISRSDDKMLHTRLIPLYRDYDPEVRACAIRATGFTGNPDIAHYLVDLLEDKTHYSIAFHALLKIGHEALDTLESAYYKTGISDKALRRITRAIARIDSNKKFEILPGKLDHSSLAVVNEALTGLINSGFRPSSNEMEYMIPSLKNLLETAASNLAILVSLRTFMPDANVTIAMEEEYRENTDMIFSFLALAYDPHQVFHIRKNYESGTNEGIGFAIELLDLFIDDTIKPFLFPLFEDSADIEKIKNLQSEYAVEIQKPPHVLFSILNSSIKQIGYFARICALQELMDFKEFHLENVIVAQTFHPNIAIRQAAGSVIGNYNYGNLSDIQRRLEMEMDQSDDNNRINFTDNSEIEKIKYLDNSDTFSSLKRKLLPEFACKFRKDSIPAHKNRKISEFFNNKEAIFIIKGDILFYNLSLTIFKPEKDAIFLVSEIMRATTEECMVSSNEGLDFLRVKEEDLRELFFDYENESVNLIPKMVLSDKSILK